MSTGMARIRTEMLANAKELRYRWHEVFREVFLNAINPKMFNSKPTHTSIGKTIRYVTWRTSNKWSGSDGNDTHVEPFIIANRMAFSDQEKAILKLTKTLITEWDLDKNNRVITTNYHYMVICWKGNESSSVFSFMCSIWTEGLPNWWKWLLQFEWFWILD